MNGGLGTNRWEMTSQLTGCWAWNDNVCMVQLKVSCYTLKERKHRRSLVAEMKKARDEGKRAFIRYSDGKLIVNGKVTIPPGCPANITEDTADI